MEKCYITKNQIPIFHYPGNHLHGFCLSLYLHAGSLYETKEENGISHFLEHVVIRNINHLMDGKLYQQLDRLGLLFNACTYKEFVQFEITGAAKNFCKAVDIFVKIFEGISLPASEIGIERKRIKAEIREDDEKSTMSYFTKQIVWEGTSAAQMITGTSSGLDRMGKLSLQEAHKKLFSSDNMFFYVTGKAEQMEVDYLKAAVEQYEIQNNHLKRENCVEVPNGFGERHGIVAMKKSEDTIVRFSFDLSHTQYSQAVYVLLYDILFECENSKIHQTLSEEAGFIYSFDSGMEQYRNIGNLSFQYEVQPVRLLDSIRMVVEVFQQLKKGITDELEFVKASYIDNSEMILDHASDLNWAQAYDGHILGKISTDLLIQKRDYEQVTAEMITELARNIFCCKNLVVTVKGKKSKKLEQQIRDIILEID